MKVTKKLFALVLVFNLIMLTGCQSRPSESSTPKESSSKAADSSTASDGSQEGGSAELEPMELTMYLIGDTPTEGDAVYAKINEILKEKLNTTVNVEWLSWTEHGTKYSLLFSGNEDFDMIFSATGWGHFEQTAALGGYAALSEEMIQTYAPDVWNTLPKEAWNQVTINGSIYMIPANFVECNSNVLAIRGDLLKKYGYEEMDSYDKFISFLKDCAKDKMYGFSGGGAALHWLIYENEGYYIINGTPSDGHLLVYNYANPTNFKFENILEWEPFINYCKDMKELADMGAWSSDVLNDTGEQDGLITGRSAAACHNVGALKLKADEANGNDPSWDVNLYDIRPNVPFRMTSYANAGMSFNANSKKLERALMVYNEFATNPEIQDLAQLGIEGQHWTKKGDQGYQLTDTPYSASNFWGWRNLDIMRKSEPDNPTPVDIKADELNEYFLEHRSQPHLLDGFSFNQESVATQCAAIDAVKATYLGPLTNGLVDDVDATIAEYKNALDAAGMQDVMDELQRQIDEFVAANSAE